MNYLLRSHFTLIGLMFITLLITACGGGGGGDGRTDYQPIVYSGNKDVAVITTKNATSLVNNIIGSSEITDHISPSTILIDDTSSQSSGLITTTHRLDNRFRNTLDRIPSLTITSSYPVGVIHVDETDYCDSGSIKSTGTLNDDGTGTLEVHYDNCRYGDETTDGYLTVRIDAFDIYYGEITDGTMNITRMTITGPGYDVSASG
ncbi:hypothetical protein KA005_42505, partial [bacterium]|nr:hypothetical protein [bacterium]